METSGHAQIWHGRGAIQKGHFEIYFLGANFVCNGTHAPMAAIDMRGAAWDGLSRFFVLAGAVPIRGPVGQWGETFFCRDQSRGRNAGK